MRRILIGAVALALATMPLQSAEARSNTISTTTLTQSYYAVKTFKVAGAPACMKVAMKGTMKITRWYGWRSMDAPGPMKAYELRNPRIVNPKLALETRRCSGARKPVRTTAWLRQLLLANNLSCKNTASISLSLPWGISLSPTESCPTRRKARLATSNGTNWRFSQYEESTVGWPRSKKWRLAASPKKITTCVTLNSHIVIRKASRTYSTGDRNVGKVCISA